MAAKVSRRRQEREELKPATGLAARLDRAARSGKMPLTEATGPRPVGVGRRQAAVRNDYDRGGLRSPAGQGHTAAPDPDFEPETWDAELPAVDPADLANALSQSLVAAEAEDGELDQLWDWIRADEDRGAKFLGQPPATSSQMRDLCKSFEVLYALYDTAEEKDKAHVGFAGFQFMTPTHAVTHLYLAEAYRGQAPRLLPQLMELAENTYPGKTFVVYTSDAAMARMLRGSGFVASFMLTWTPRPAPEPQAEPVETPTEE